MTSLIIAVLPLSLLVFGLASAGDAAAFEPGRANPSMRGPARALRATGIAHFDLSDRVRARLESSCSEDPTISDRLIRYHVRSRGPGRRTHASVENRIALTRSLSDRIEIGVVWGMRSSLADVALFDFDIDRHTVEAMIRIVR